MLVSGYWILKYNDPYFIQNRVTSIQYLVAYGSIFSFNYLLIIGSGSSGLGRKQVIFDNYMQLSPNAASKKNLVLG